MNSSNVNAEQHLQQTEPLIDPNEIPLEERPAAGAPQQQSRASQFMSNVSLDNLIRSNSFLHSDLGNFIEINPATSTAQATAATTSGISAAANMSAANSAQGFAGGAHTHAHSHSHNDANPTIVDLQGTCFIKNHIQRVVKYKVGIFILFC